MGKNKVFFPQQVLDAWVVSHAVQLTDNDLLLTDDGKQFRYQLAEGAMIAQEVSGNPDAHDIVGKCKTLASLRQMGADILQQSMIIEDNAYAIITGFLGTPVSRSNDAGVHNPRTHLRSDEELLALFLAKNM